MNWSDRQNSNVDNSVQLKIYLSISGLTTICIVYFTKCDISKKKELEGSINL